MASALHGARVGVALSVRARQGALRPVTARPLPSGSREEGPWSTSRSTARPCSAGPLGSRLTTRARRGGKPDHATGNFPLSLRGSGDPPQVRGVRGRPPGDGPGRNPVPSVRSGDGMDSQRQRPHGQPRRSPAGFSMRACRLAWWPWRESLNAAGRERLHARPSWRRGGLEMAFHQIEGRSLVGWSVLVEASTESEASEAAVRVVGCFSDLPPSFTARSSSQGCWLPEGGLSGDIRLRSWRMSDGVPRSARGRVDRLFATPMDSETPQSEMAVRRSLADRGPSPSARSGGSLERPMPFSYCWCTRSRDLSMQRDFFLEVGDSTT
jgi:hypothetical protein